MKKAARSEEIQVTETFSCFFPYFQGCLYRFVIFPACYSEKEETVLHLYFNKVDLPTSKFNFQLNHSQKLKF